MNNMVQEKNWEEFRDAGFLWLINQSLHLFGWAIVVEMEHGKISRAYPARVKYRGFPAEYNDNGYQKVSKYLRENIDEIEKETHEW